MFGFGILSGLLILPLVGAAFILCLRGDSEAVRSNAKWAALATTVVTFLLSLWAWGRFDTTTPAFQLVESHAWVTDTIRFKLGVDGFSMPFILLTTFLMPFCILASWESIEHRLKEYMVAFLVLETTMIGVFAALDLVLFYLFFEAGLIPMFLIIGIWGGKRRIYASFKFFLYTLLARSDAPRHHGDVLHGRHHRHPDPAADEVRLEPPVLALARLLRLLRGEDAHVAGPYLAAGRPRGGADRGLR
jgi:NADH-quinone oxidoreductase subunit M